MAVTVVGSANMDLVVRCPSLPRAGETLAGATFDTVPGGKGANQAVAIGSLGGDARFVGKVGKDAFGEALVESMRNAGVHVEGLLHDPANPTGVALITVDKSGQNTIIVVPGANSKLLAHEAQRAVAGDDGPLLLQCEIPLETVREVLRSAPSRLKILNPAPVSKGVDDLLPLADILTPNEIECETLTGISPVDNPSCWMAGKALLNKGVGQVVITLGARGCYIFTANGGWHVPTIEVKVVDTTAAGDAFSGALAHFLDQGRDINRAAELANRVAALSTTKRGAQGSMPSIDDLRSVARELL